MPPGHLFMAIGHYVHEFYQASDDIIPELSFGKASR